MQKLKLIISSYDDIQNPHYAGGGAYAIHEIAKRFAKEADVTVLTGNYKGAKSEFRDGVLYKRIGVKYLGPKIGQLFFHFTLPFFVLRNNFDVWIESFTPPFSTSFLPIFTRKPVIGLAHMLSGKDMRRKYRLPFDLIERIGLKFYKNLICLSETDGQKAIKANNKISVEIIPNGVDIPKLMKRKRKHLLFLGRIEVNQKGLDLLLKAYKKIANKTIPKLIIAGSGAESEVSKLEKLIKELELVKKVKFIRRVEGNQKKELFEKAYVVVVPSRYETYSMVALEALSYQTPLVTFNIDGMRWLPKDWCVKIPAHNTNQLAKVIVDLVNDKNLRKKYANKGYEFVKKYSWDNVFLKYKNYINELILQSDDFSQIVKKITDKKLSCIFISPHYDDAIFSAGSLIRTLSDRCEVSVVNVFTKGSLPPYSLSVKAYLRKCGFKDATTCFRIRNQEDRRVFSKLGLKRLNLGFVDAMWRQKGNNNSFPNFVYKLLPELELVYPIYRLHVIGGVVARQDSKLAEEIAVKLKKLIDPSSIIFCPSGIGSHVDHIIVRDICKKLFKNVVFWEDFPYNLKEKNYCHQNDKIFKEYVFNGNPYKKKNLMLGYESQIKATFPDANFEIPKERYWANSKNMNIN